MKREDRAAVLGAAARIGALTLWIASTALASPESKPTAPPTPVADPLSKPLAERIAGKRPLDDVRIDVDWVRGSAPVHARIYGDGAAIWQRRVQFSLTRDQVIAILKLLRDARFGAMEGTFGADMEGETESPLRLRGRIVLRLGPQVKRVAQFVDGDQSPELAALADKILSICEGPAARGKGTASLSAGLRSLAANELFPETLSVALQRVEAGVKEGESKSESKETRWILRVDGRSATDREILPGRRPPAPRRLILSETEFRSLAKALSSEPVESLPANLYAPVYTDLRVAVLDQSRGVIARPFLNTTPETHGEKQKAFDRIFAVLQKLHERVQREGRPFEEVDVDAGERKREAEERRREEEREREREREGRERTKSSQPPGTPVRAPSPVPSPPSS